MYFAFQKKKKFFKQKSFKVDLHSIRFLSVFVCFLRFCFSVKKYAHFCAHFYKSITALIGLLYINKNLVQKNCV